MGHIQLLEYMSGQTLEGENLRLAAAGADTRTLAGAVASRLLSMLVISEDLPMPHNRCG